MTDPEGEAPTDRLLRAALRRHDPWRAPGKDDAGPAPDPDALIAHARAGELRPAPEGFLRRDAEEIHD